VARFKIIKKSQAKIVDLGTKIIRKYASSDRKLEINHMKITGRHPENPDHFIFETKCHFMVYIISGEGYVYCDDKKFKVGAGDVIDVPVSTRYAVEGDNLEYLTCEHPAWFAEQASIVDSKGIMIEDTKK